MANIQNLPDNGNPSGLWASFVYAVARTTTFADYFEPLIQLLKPTYVAGKIPARVVQIRHENDHVYSLVLKPGRGFKGFEAGQYVELCVQRDGRRFSRYFSISSGVQQFRQQGTIELSIRVQENGHITPWLRLALTPGAKVHLGRAQGEFVLQNQTAPLLMLAGGSGITPFRSMLAGLQNYPQPVTLLYYAQDASAHLFKRELLARQADMPHVRVVLVDSQAEGFFSEQHLDVYCADYARRDIYICGPAPMITHSRKLLAQLGVAEANIHFEFFSPAPLDLDGIATGGITEFRRSAVQSVNPEQQQTLLDMAENAGLKPASGCRMGVCYQCICKKESGVVFNTKTGQYSDTGAQDVQMCVSVPVGDVVLDI